MSLSKLLTLSFLLSAFVYSDTVSAHSTRLPRSYRNVVVEEVIRVYSQDVEDSRFTMTKDDIWDLKSAPNDPSKCIATVTGFAKRPSRQGSSLYRFWVCVVEHNGRLTGELLDDTQVADE